jgi:STE24 endopeptidase
LLERGLLKYFLLSRRIFLGVCLVFCAPATTAAAQTTPAAASGASTASTAEQIKAAPDNEKSETTTQAETEQYTLSHERYDKAVAYARAEYTLYFISVFFGFLVLLLILRMGIAAKLRDIAERAAENRFVQGLVFTALLCSLLDVLDLPLRIYWHSLSLRYEQSIQGWGSWIWDWAKGELLGIGIAFILVVILFAVIRRSPRRWWLYFWFAALPILFFIFFISPWYIDPLFNKFKPLSDTQPQLVASIAKLSDHAGVPIPPERMFLMVASAKTNTVNAYVTGVGASKRVVVWDTTIRKTTLDETLFVVGHELGHYALNHTRNGFLFFAVGLLLTLYFGYRGLHWALDRWGKDWRVYGQADWAALAVLLLVMELLMFVASPVENGFSRMQEHAADVYGLEVIHGIVPNSEQVAAHAFQVMGEIDLSDPNPSPLITFWLYSHPPLAERLVFAHNYDPWSKGESPKYVKK